MEVIEHHHREVGMGALAVLHQGADVLDGGAKARFVEQLPHRLAIGLEAGLKGRVPALKTFEVLTGDQAAPALQVAGGIQRRGHAHGAAAVVGHQPGQDRLAGELTGEHQQRGAIAGQSHGGGDRHGGFADAGAGRQHPGALTLARDDAAAHVQIQ